MTIFLITRCSRDRIRLTKNERNPLHTEKNVWRVEVSLSHSSFGCHAMHNLFAGAQQSQKSQRREQKLEHRFVRNQRQKKMCFGAIRFLGDDERDVERCFASAYGNLWSMPSLTSFLQIFFRNSRCRWVCVRVFVWHWRSSIEFFVSFGLLSIDCRLLLVRLSIRFDVSAFFFLFSRFDFEQKRKKRKMEKRQACIGTRCFENSFIYTLSNHFAVDSSHDCT